MLRLFRRWKTKLLGVDNLEAIGDEFLDGKEGRVARDCWNRWKRELELRSAEKAVIERVSLRITENAMNVCKNHV